MRRRCGKGRAFGIEEPQRLKPAWIQKSVRGAKAPLFHIAVVVLASFPLAAQKTAPEASSRSGKSSQSAKLTAPDPGTLADGAYHNAFFGLRCKVPYGWVDRTREMREGAETGKSMLLLSVFERPPEASGDTVNSAIVVTAEPMSAYPRLKTAADYFEPVTELATGKGFKVDNEPYEIALGATHLVRADFSKAVGSVTMHQSSLALVARGYILSFTIIAGSADEAESLVEQLSFGAAKSGTRAH